jgi:hypothetical protein
VEISLAIKKSFAAAWPRRLKRRKKRNKVDMSGYYANILSSILEAMSCILPFVLSTCFWGRFYLRPLKLKFSSGYGQPLTMVAGLTLMAYVAWLLHGTVENYSLFLTLYFYAGFVGFIAETLIFGLRPLLRSANKAVTLKDFCCQNKIFMSFLVQATILAFFYSAVWPSGRMENWMAGSADYYYWPLFADYWLGQASPDVLPFSSDFVRGTIDSFGAHLTMALYEVGSQKGAFFSLPSFLIAFAAFCGVAVHSLVAKIFRFPWPLCLLAALGLVSGPFFNYISVVGMSGQLLAMFAFLTALDVLYGWSTTSRPGWKEYAAIFVPVFYIFLSYQGGYVGFAVMIGANAGLWALFNGDSVGKTSRWLWALKLGLMITAGLTAVACLLEPTTALHLASRTKAVVVQDAGWTLPLLNPLMFSGLPIFTESPFRLEEIPGQNILSAAFWLVFFLLIVAVLLYYCIRLIDNNTYYKFRNNKGNIFSVASFYGVSLILYLLIFLINGNSYQIWKFVSYFSLPVSFVPFSLLILVSTLFYAKFRKKIVCILSCLLIIIMFFIGIKPVLLQGKLLYYYRLTTIDSLLDVINRINTNKKPGIKTYYYMANLGSILLVAEFYKKQKNEKMNILQNVINYDGILDYTKIFDEEDFIVVTDVEPKKMFNSRKENLAIDQMRVLDKDFFRLNGYVSLNGVDTGGDWSISGDFFLTKISLPEDLIGKDVQLRILLEQKTAERSDFHCQAKGAAAKIEGLSEEVTSEPDTLEIVEKIPANLTVFGVLEAVVRIYAEDSSPKEQEKCKPIVFLKSIDVE